MYFLILYQGFKTDQFYWEFINTARKILIMMAFLMPLSIQILFSLSVLIITWRVQVRLEPYKYKYNNFVEILGVTAGIVTVCSSLVYQNKTTERRLDMMILIAVILINCKFILEWLYLLLENFKEKYKAVKFVSYENFIIQISIVLKGVLFKRIEGNYYEF